MKKFRTIFIAAAGMFLLAGCASSRPAATPQETTTAAAEATTAATSAGTTAPETMAAEGSAAEESTTAKNAGDPSAVSADSFERPTVRVGGLKGPTTMGLVQLMDASQSGVSENDYEFTMVTAADELTALIASDKADIALLPANVASVLYSKTNGKVSVIDINTLGVLYLVSADTSITSLEQLKGRTVYLPGKGTTPEYTLRYLLSASGLSEQDVTLEFKSEAAEVASVLSEDASAIGLLPQPFVTAAIAQNDRLSVIMDMTEVWDSLQTDGEKSRLVTGVTIVNNSFLEAHPEAVDTFLKEHEASIHFTNEDVAASSEMIAAAGIVAKAPLAAKALPYCNITFLSGEEMKAALSGYLSVLYSQNPDSVGGKLPDDAFYYIP